MGGQAQQWATIPGGGLYATADHCRDVVFGTSEQTKSHNRGLLAFRQDRLHSRPSKYTRPTI